jgi:triphosphoribosyl-dephospho-CoA synthase
MTVPIVTAPNLTADEIARAFLGASRAELHALKPGNVHIFADGHRMTVADFEASAVACAPWIAQRGASVGERIEGAVRASFSASGCNTNLGIILLCAPLAKAAESQGGPLRERLNAVLAALDQRDAACAYRAIALANPAGLGHVRQSDVSTPPNITLLEAMALAREHDRIANAYVDTFADIFGLGFDTLASARSASSDVSAAITTLHMTFLSIIEDTHIVRKFGHATARVVLKEAFCLREFYVPITPDSSHAVLMAFDGSLKSRGLNPGTTADFVVATLFADQLCG